MIKMRGHRILVDPDPIEKTYGESKIVIVQDEDLERTGVQRGVIVDMGPDCFKAYRTVDNDGIERNGEAWCQVGDYILYSRHAGRFVTDPFDNDYKYLVMNDEDVLGIYYPGKNDIPDSPTRREVVKYEDSIDG